MDRESELLQAVHENAEMGTLTTPQLMALSEDEALRRVLQGQLKSYRAVADRAESLLTQRGQTPKGPGEWQERMAGVMLRMKTLTDRSSSRIADMLIQGGTMGIVQMTRQIHQCEAAADSDAMELARKLVVIQERNIEELKSFL